jgi:uncharacterized protein
MPFEWDEAKRAGNAAKHGLDLALAEQFEWEEALVRADVRFDYGEIRLVAIGPMQTISDRLFVIVFTVERRTVRVISLRRANNREIRRYEQEI